MRYCFTLFVLLWLAAPAFSQKGSVQGVAYDTLAKRPVADATVTVLQKKDSSLVGFVMTDNAGRFSLTDLATGEYRLLITHVGYHNRSIHFSITDSLTKPDLGQLVMNDRTQVLDEVIVRSEAPPVTLVGDTVQYNASSFKTPPNASVEQLLKKLPGVQVDKDGTVKAQGQTVNRVLVDGKEFFGKDPKMATKNLPADAIDKVQVYDRQSDQAQLTGFDDGNSEKTINLKLKKDKKKGAFGKIMAGGGTRDRLEGRFNVNSFKGARQMSVVGLGNNNNTEGFSFMDMMNFTGELSRMMRNGGGNVSMNMSDNSLAGLMGNNNRGIRTIWGGGINYNNIIGTKLDFTSNYFYNHFNPQVNSDVRRQYLLPDSSYLYNQQSVQDNNNNSHRLNLGFDYFIDSFHSIKVNPSLGYQQTRNRTSSNYTQLGEDGLLSNEGYNNRATNNDAFNFSNDILFRKKFHRKGRTLSLALQTTLNNSDGDSRFESVNQFYDRMGTRYRTDSINQRSYNESSLTGYTGRLVYTEPLFRRSLLELSVANSNTRSRSDKITYDYDAGSAKYDQLNDSLTNNFRNTYGYNNAGIRLRTQQRKYNYSVGLNWQRSTLEGKVISGIKDTIIGKTFYNLLPNARVQYNFSRFKNLTLNYRTSTNQPSVEQLQPVPDISNPLAIREGNPDLKQEYSHNLQLNYTGVNPFKNKNFFAFINFMRTDNKIVNSDSVFSNGVRKSRPVNTDGVYTVVSDINLGLPIRFLKGSLQLGTNTFYNKSRQFINGQANDINMLSVGPRISLELNPHEKLNLTFTAGGNINHTRYSLQKAFNNRYFSQLYEAQVEWDLPGGFHFSTEFAYNINNQLAAGFNTKVPLWHAAISKQMLKFNRGELKIRVNDMLNQNIGVSRNSNQNYIEDSRVNTLRRYAMISFTYSLSKTGLGANQGSNMRIITR
jgi:hypothetical protein